MSPRGITRPAARRPARGLILPLLVAALCACPLAIEPEDSGSSLIGAPCSEHADCAVGYCEKSMPGGYCLQTCDQEPCPAGSRCVSFPVPLLPALLLCQRTCEQTADCGRPGYVCSSAPDGGSLICNGVRE